MLRSKNSFLTCLEKSPLFLAGCAFLLVAVVFPHAAHASASSGGGLPYESWLTSLRQSVTGPVAFSVAIMSLVGAGSMLIFGGADMNGFLRTMIYLVLVMALVVGAQNIMSSFFGKGAEVAFVLPTLPGQSPILVG